MTWQQELDQLISAIVVAEGGKDAFVRAVRCSLPATKDYVEAVAIAKNTILHQLWNYTMRDPDSFISWFASRPDPEHPGKNTGWAPRGADNDPDDLNKNWPHNVLAAWHRV